MLLDEEELEQFFKRPCLRIRSSFCLIYLVEASTKNLHQGRSNGMNRKVYGSLKQKPVKLRYPGIGRARSFYAKVSSGVLPAPIWIYWLRILVFLLLWKWGIFRRILTENKEPRILVPENYSSDRYKNKNKNFCFKAAC